ncbi:hypothetical protein C4577_06935 [Candidatus Parcubacteria bacterium]|nr:MAG: hypothetical protein C4577_06935 [Candidatus Parcubacteria bacterium]
MRKLFLTSEGLVSEVREYFVEMILKKPEDTKIVFIANAGDVESDKAYIEEDKRLIEDMGFLLGEIDLKQESENSLREKIDGFDAVFVEGGNTFYLLDLVRKSGFDKVLIEFLDKGKIYVGVSAGSILVGPDIKSALWQDVGEYPDKDIVGLKDSKGLGIVPFAVSPHILPQHLDALRKRVKEVNYPVVSLTDKQAVKVIGDKYEIVGEGEKLVYNNVNNLSF